MNKEDYCFYIVWEDIQKNPYRIGLFAQIEKKFYLRMNNRNSENIKFAYDRGCIGISGFEEERVYKSNELFDFFKNRILHKESKTPCEELAENSGKSMTDSFSVEEVPEIWRDRCKDTLLKAYKYQEESKKEER